MATLTCIESPTGSTTPRSLQLRGRAHGVKRNREMKQIRAEKAGQARPSPAEIYEQRFVPALFEPWSRVVVRAAQIGLRQHVLDVACGTGVLATAAAERVGTSARVVGLDASAEMLAVARRKLTPIQWVQGRAESLPFDNDHFDAVVSQFGLMFFEQPAVALREMMSVLRPGGHLAVAVCGALDHSPGYAALAALLHELFGARVADAFRAPFVMGDAQRLPALCSEAGITGAVVTRHSGTVRFASIEDLIAAERACAWTLGGLLDAPQFAQLLRGAQQALKPFAGEGGGVAFDMPALIVTATKAAHS
jgi:SAM-dependent methyltransferase